MKKVYVKPDVVFESFASTMSIALAGDCAKPTHTPQAGNCGIDLGGGWILFWDSIGSNCTDRKVPGSDGDYNGICYHSPEGNNLFNS